MLLLRIRHFMAGTAADRNPRESSAGHLAAVLTPPSSRKTPPMSRSVDRCPGRPVEILVYKLIQGTRCRTRVAHLTVDSNLRTVLVANGPGRYRVEWRDRRRWITQVHGIWVWQDGRVQRVQGRKPRPRKLGAPKKVS